MKKFFLSLIGIALATTLSWSQSSVADQLVYDDFEIDGVETVALHEANSPTGFGWGAAWKQQNGNTDIPGFNITEENPLAYPGLISTPKYAVGGYAWQGSGRVLDCSAEGAFAEYLTDASRIGKSGTVLWFSTIYRRDGNASNVITFHNDGNMGSINGALGITIQDNEFALRMEGAEATPVKTGVTATVGETFLVVAKMEFGDNTDDNKHKVSLFINPAIGGAEPTAQATAESSNGNIPFSAIGWYPGPDPGLASIDEIRFGKTFASVTPAKPGYSDVTAITLSVEGDVTEIPRGTKIRINATLTPDDGNPELTWSVEPGTGDAEISTTGILWTKKNGTVTVKAKALSGVEGSKEFTITDAEFKPTITATATEVTALSPTFNIVFNENDEIVEFNAGMVQVNGTAGEGAVVKLSGNFPNYTATVFGLTRSGEVSLTIPAGAVKLKYDSEYGNVESVSNTVNYSRNFPVSAEEDLNIVYFNGNDLKNTVTFDREKYVVDAESAPYVATLAFDDTKSIFDGVALGSAFKGGMRFDHSDGDRNPDYQTIDLSRLLPSLVQFDSNDERAASFWMQQSGNNEATSSAFLDDVTFSFVWTKDQFMNGAAESNVAFDEHSTIRLNMTAVVESGKLHCIVKNGNQYYISQTGQTTSAPGMFTFANFNNTEDQKWLQYDPTTLAIPADFAEATAVDFNDVQAVGFIYNAVHQWHRNIGFNLFSVEGVKKVPQPLLYDGFAYLPDSTLEAGGGNLNEEPIRCNGGYGWSGAWSQHEAGHIVMKPAEGYGALSTTGLWAEYEGGSTYSCGAIRNLGSEFDPYRSRENGAKLDQGVLWASTVMKPIEGGLTRLAFGARFNNQFDMCEGISVFYNASYDKLPQSANWQVLVGKNGTDPSTYEVLDSEIPAVSGIPTLLVMKIDFDNSKITLFVNPDMSLEEPTGGVEQTFTQSMAFQNIGLQFDSKAGAAIDEVRLGASYRSVVPAGPTISFDLADQKGVAVDSKITATADMAVYMPDLSELSETALGEMFELKRGEEVIPVTVSVGTPRSEFIITPDGALLYDNEYTITLKSGVMSNGTGVLNAASSATFRTIADVTALNAKIEASKSMHDAAVEGSELGQYDPGSKELFSTAIAAAEAVAGDVVNKTQGEVDNALTALTEAERLFNLSKVGVQIEAVIFKEGFKYNTWHQANANNTGELEMGSEHYFAEPIYISGNWGGEKGWPNTSDGANLNLSPTLDCPEETPDCGIYKFTEITIQKLNTTVITDPKLSLAQVWDPILVSYSTDQGGNWTPMTARTEVWRGENGSQWIYYTYNDVLPSAEDLWIKIEKENKTSGTTLLDDITVSGTASVPSAAFNIENGSKGVDPESAITLTSDVALVNALDLSEITEPTSLFVLKKNDANGEDVAFTAAIDDTKKVFTITPESALSINTTYYVALKNRVVANEFGARALLTESTFTTIADFSALNAKIDEAQALYDEAVESEKNGDYIIGSKATFNEAIQAALAVKEDTKSDQTAIDEAVTALDEAINVFKSSKVVVDYTALNEAVSAAETLLSEAVEGEKNGDYIIGSKDTYQQAIDAAKGVADNTVATQAEVNAAKEALDGATSTFSNAKVVVDYAALNEAISAAETLLSEAVEGDRNGDYATGSKDTYQQAIDAAKVVAGNTVATQAEVDAAKEALDGATSTFNNAKVVVDYDALNAAIEAAKAIIDDANYATDYTEDSRNNFESALDAAQTASANTTATQAEVDEAKANLEEAQNGLKHVGIDGTELSEISVYPNPAIDYIRIEGAEDATVTIVSMNGALVLSVDAYMGENIDISALSSGTYIVKIDDKITTFIKK